MLITVSLFFIGDGKGEVKGIIYLLIAIFQIYYRVEIEALD